MTDWTKVHAALDEYVATEPERDALLDEFTDENITRWIDALAVAEKKVAEVYYEAVQSDKRPYISVFTIADNIGRPFPPTTITKREPPEVGDTIYTWASGREDGMATVLEVRPYTGRYPEFFSCIVTHTVERKHGYGPTSMETAW